MAVRYFVDEPSIALSSLAVMAKLAAGDEVGENGLEGVRLNVMIELHVPDECVEIVEQAAKRQGVSLRRVR